MAIQSSCSNDICVVTGNELKLFIDSCTNLISVKDSNGVVQSLDNFIVDEGITRVIAGECLTGGGTSATVTLNHACTSTLSGTYGQPLLQDGCYIKSITVDEFGHLTGVTTDNFNTYYLGINACAVDSALLNNQAGSYYLDFCNFTNVPPLGDICGVCAGDGLGGGGDTGIVTLVNTDKGSSQNIIKNICANTGGFTVGTNNGLFCILGSGDISTSILGNTLSISSSTTVNNCLITLSAGTGLSGGGSFNLNQASNCTVSFTNTDKGSDQSIFKNIAVSGQTSVVADNNNDTLTFINGTDISVTTNPATQSITISSTAPTVYNCQIQITGGDGLSGSATFTLNQNGNGSFALTNADKGSSQCFFQSIEVIGSCTVTAEQNNDTLCLSAGTGITLTSDNTQDLITIGTTATSCTGTVTSVGATTGTTGTDFNISGSPVTTSGTITFNLPSASATNRGALTSADWSTFNSKTSCTGTVTSVGLTTGETGTDVSVSGSPVTTSGAITLNIPIASATNTGKLSSTDWTDFNNKVDDVTAGTGISVSGTDTIQVTNTDLGSSQCIFKNLAVSGQNTIVADSNNDTLTFAGSGIAITTDDTTDTVTFTVTDAGGTVTSVGLDTGTTGTDVNVSGSPVTTSGNITLNIPDASASSRGALTSTDWTTFNNKTTCTGTVTSVGITGGEGIVASGTNPVTSSGTIALAVCLNELSTSIDNGDGCFFAVVDASGVQNKLTKSNINISGFNNDAGFTTCTGTVSSVAVSGGTGISVSGSPITGSGTITVSNTDRGSSQNIFKNVAVSGQTTIVADSNNDTLTLVNGSNIFITTNATSDTLTISTSATTCTGTITGVTAGTGLSGGGTSGSVTLTNTDKGSDQCIFKTISVSGQNDIVADSNSDTITLVAGTGITITTDDTTDTITINSPDAGGTVTSVGATTGTTGTDFSVSGSPITTSGTLTFNLPVASATNTGKLSNTDWSTFNSKTSCTGTVTSVSGGTGLTGTVTTSGSISVNYSGASNIINSATDCTTVAVDNGDRLMTVNKTTNVVEFHRVIDLPFTSCTGTVTNVGATTGTSGTDFNISGSPITGSGTITFNLPTASAINTGKLSSTDWSTFNSKTTCTGTVTSVAVTGGVGIDVSGSPITGSGTIDLTIDLNELTTSTSDADGDFFAVVDTLGNQKKLTKGNINLSGFNNDAGFTTCVGDITGVTAGVGLSGGGTSGSVTLTNSDRGSSQNIFKNVAVSGQGTIVADSNNDTLTFANGSNITISTNNLTDTVTISSSATTCTGTVTGTGTANILPKWSSSTALTDSCVGDDGTLVCINANLRTGATDNISTGGLSFAGGEISCATGCQSIAYGYCNNSSGGASASFGALNTASGSNSFVGGGANNVASGVESFVANQGNTASNFYASAFGINNTSSGGASWVGGSSSTASGTNSFSFGVSNTIASNCSYAFGRMHNIPSGRSDNFIGGGVGNTINSVYGGNSIFGSNNRVDNGYNNTVIGGTNCSLLNCSTSNVRSGNSLVMGFCNRNCGFAYSSLTGGECTVNFSCAGIAFGCGATASAGISQFSFGRGTVNPNNGTTANIEGSTVVGRYNVHSTTACHLFAVGTGTASFSRCTALNVDSNGRVGIGVLIPSCQLQLSQNSAGKPISSSWCIVSDERLKCNIRPYQKGLNEIIQVNTKVFDYNGKGNHPKHKDAVGIIAQEMIEIFPETINSFKGKLNETDEKEVDLLGYDSHAITYALINAVKELNQKIISLENKIKTLESN